MLIQTASGGLLHLRAFEFLQEADELRILVEGGGDLHRAATPN
ncbi:hypothetical protein X772_02960 [Mesorhizobium sp. LSJC280B00]|nr:hypothetical protein X772_02960 [Mesorhizobium sp. LSJC280B00]